MSTFTQVYGIDVSKDTLDILKLDRNSGFQEKDQLENEFQKIDLWVAKLCTDSSLCVVEATGTYSSTLIYLLDQYQVQVAVVSPFKSRAFMNALGKSNQTDDLAAYCLAMMGLQLDLTPYQMPPIHRQKRKQLQTAHHALQKQGRMLKNQLHALDQLPVIEPLARAAYENTLETIEKQIKQLEQQIEELEEDPLDQQIKTYACSVVGIGAATAQAMILASNGFENFESADALAKYFGLTPHSHSSGSSVRKKGRITKMGAHYVRSLLYMCTRSAIRYNLACKELYNRLRARGKPHKVAAVAVMRKLVKQVFVCVKKKTKFDNQYYLKFKTT